MQKIIVRTSLQSFIIKQYQKDIVTSNQFKVTGKEYMFSPETSITNMQNNPAKISIGANSQIFGALLVFKYGGKISIGNNCFIGNGSRIWSGEEVIIA